MYLALLGIVLLIFELFFTTFLIFPIGIGLILFDVLYGFTGLYVALFFAIGVPILLYYYIFSTSKSNSLSLGFKMPHHIEGEKGTVLKVLEDGYIVEVNGQQWRAISKQKLNKGDKVVVDKLESITAVVRKIE